MTFSKNITAVLIASLFGTAAFAQVKQTVLERGKHNHPIYVVEEMRNLVSNTQFDGLYFKIVKGKSNNAISLTEADEALRLKAATTYYTLNLAHDFWVNKMHNDNVINMQKVVVRLEITNKFDELSHYDNDEIDPQTNDALSVAPGHTDPDIVDSHGKHLPAESWGPEIWFRPKKKMLTADLANSGLGADGNPLVPYINMLADPIKSSTINRFIQTTLQKIFYPSELTTSYQTSVLQQVGTLAVLAAILEASKHTDKIFLEKYYYLDTAMIPEIIRHEYSHVAMSDKLTLGLSTPILEGMADYFSTTMTNNPTIAKNINKYSLSMPKNGKNKTNYSPILESNTYANSDFVLSLLWSVRKALPDSADRLIFDARLHMNTGDSDIRTGLIGALLESCNTMCTEPSVDRMTLRQIFEDRGF